MFDAVRNRATLASKFLLLAVGVAATLSLWACGSKSEQPSAGQSQAQAAPKLFASPDEAGKALFDASKSGNQDAVMAIFGQGAKQLVSTSDAAEDKIALENFAKAYQQMNRWRKLADGSEILLVGADNQAFPIPLKTASGQWFFDAAAGKEEIIARRIGRDEIVAMDACGALAEAQAQYFAQKHGGVKQYAQKFISDPGQQNGLYWESPAGAPRSPMGPARGIRHRRGTYHQVRRRTAFLRLLLPQAGWSGRSRERWRETVCRQWQGHRRIRLRSLPREI